MSDIPRVPMNRSHDEPHGGQGCLFGIALIALGLAIVVSLIWIAT